MLTVDTKILELLDDKVEKIEDVRGLNCPLPILRTKKALATLSGGALLKVLTTDKAAVSDLSVFTLQTGHVLKAQVMIGNEVAHYIERKKT